MKKVFISQPMRGLTDEQILTNKEEIMEEVYQKYQGEVEFVDSFFGNFDGKALEFLAKSIALLAQADLAVFGKGWGNARGCRVEELVAREYDIERYYC